jgi:outer membrane protein
MMRNTTAIAGLLALGLAAPVAAQDAAREQTAFDGDYLSVGLGAGYGPSYVGSNDYVIFPAALVQGSLKGVEIDSRNAGVALDFIPKPADGIGLKLGVSGRARFDRTGKTHDPVVDQLGKLDTAVEFGPMIGVRIPHLLNPYDALTLTTEANWDLAGAHKGMVTDTIVNYFTPLSRAMAASVSVNAETGNGKFENYYYSVTPVGAAASGLPVFKASSGFTDVGARVLLGYDLDGNLANGGLALVVAGSYSHMLGDAKRSPLVSIRGSADQWIGAVGVGYTF